MKKFLNVFFVTLGIIFFIIILAVVYFVVADPLGIRPLMANLRNNSVNTTESTDAPRDNDSMLSASQQKTLETFGIDPNTIPAKISPEQESCFIEILGESRVNEIKAGDSPTATEFFKARGCI